MKIQDRVREFKRVPAGQIAPHPRNWRTHGTAQRDALKGLLAEIGFAGAVLTREQADGTLQLIDGHLRTETLPQDYPVPCLVLDVTEEEAEKLLASFDPVAAMAGADAEKLEALLRDVQTGSEALAGMLSELAAEHGITPPDFQPVGIEEQGRLDEKAKVACPECGHEFTP